MNKNQDPIDLFIVGGGINGVGIAADAAGRDLSVILCEQGDLAQGTSSASSKLIHGGLRYLEHHQYRLVREALAEREVMLRKAPHIVSPMRFRLPHQPHLRPAWMIRLGLFLYDFLGKRETLLPSKAVRFDASGPLNHEIKRGFEYSDCYVDDARLVVLNAIAARNKGAKILTRTRCINATRQGKLWKVQLENSINKQRSHIFAKGLVNAAGPWIGQFIQDSLKLQAAHDIRLIKGSHIIVPKIHDEDQAYILQNKDKRIVFVIPYQGDFSLIGTTEVEYHGDPAKVEISQEEIHYLIDLVNGYFNKKIYPKDVLSSFSGVRPLYDDASDRASKITRDYSVEVEDDYGQAPLVSIFGGKITTYRKLAETAMNKLTPYFEHMGPQWTQDAPLPGVPDIKYPLYFKKAFKKQLFSRFPWLLPSMATRFSRSYGTLCLHFLAGTSSLSDLGEHFGEGLYAAEVEYLMNKEWCHSLEDILWRRTKLGLKFDKRQTKALSIYINQSKPHADLILKCS